MAKSLAYMEHDEMEKVDVFIPHIFLLGVALDIKQTSETIANDRIKKLIHV